MTAICQSCAMHMNEDALFGKNADGTKNEDYCCYCYPNGDFGVDETMEEMIETCIPFRVPQVYPDAETARKEMLQYYPTLLRWKK